MQGSRACISSGCSIPTCNGLCSLPPRPTLRIMSGRLCPRGAVTPAAAAHDRRGAPRRSREDAAGECVWSREFRDTRAQTRAPARVHARARERLLALAFVPAEQHTRIQREGRRHSSSV
eukprot:6198390-Pleurochrysis_carterae.AAC.2